MAGPTETSVTMTLNSTIPSTEGTVEKVFTIVFPTVIFLIAVVGIFGNALVIFVVAKHRDMHNVTNYFIANLSVTDIALLVICAIPTGANICGWQINIFSCKIVTYMQFVTVQATCFTLAAMSVDRYYMIVHAVASRQKRTSFKVFFVCVVIWIVSLLLHLPLAILSELTENEGCHPPFSDNEVKKKRIYYLFMTFILYIIPLAVIIACYANILVLVWRKTTAGTESAQARKRSIKQKQKITKMVLIVVLVFVFSWGPTQCLLIWEKVSTSYPRQNLTVEIIRMSALCLAYSNSCVNPFIYAFTTASFKKCFQGALSPCCNTSRLTNGESRKYHTKVPSDDTNNITTMSCVTKL
ncbi:G-protein coupled receptor 54-like [Anneissia japonica]|uniref:G-protein coupled receptor 54-like n=1 Tax=Anneissia japonica TaxID=1529436 RepID=UPI00142561E8|nr:G-protein coupled receptor 54-like [Anneissia japonica]